MFVPFFAGIVLIAILDQVIKRIAVENLMQIGTFPLIDKVFHLTYCENTGAGFGVFANYTWLLSILTIVVVVGAV